MGQRLQLKFLTPNPPNRPEVTVDGRLAEIIYKLLLAAEDITGPESLRVTVHCQGQRAWIEVPKRY